MKYKTVKNFSLSNGRGTHSRLVRKGEIIDISDKKVSEGLLGRGYIKNLSAKENKGLSEYSNKMIKPEGNKWF